MDEVDAVVVGGGVVGLAVARELARSGRETVLLEAAARCGTRASSRSSEVLHAGIYYPTASLKARLCVQGREALLEFCREHAVPVRECGKLLVASDATQLSTLESLRRQAAANGVGLHWLDGTAAAALEPELRCRAALHSPHTAILDSGAYLAALQASAERQGAVVVCRSRVTRGVLEDDRVVLALDGTEPSLRTRACVNCAGVEAPALAHRIEGFPRSQIPPAYFVQGNYFALRGEAPFRRLIYPVPDGASLGIHLTLDLAGGARFGPDVQWVESGAGTAVDPARATEFEAAIRRYWPSLPDGALTPAYAGVRARISAPGKPLADFRIDGPETHGVPGVVHCFGIESPGLTASLALASEAVRRLG
jgi:L-2-hydroxyglutarate oxidase LhgO